MDARDAAAAAVVAIVAAAAAALWESRMIKITALINCT